MASIENRFNENFNEKTRRIVESTSIRKYDEDKLYKNLEKIKRAIGYDGKRRLDETIEKYIHEMMISPRRTRKYNN